MTARRNFIRLVAVSGAALVPVRAAWAQAAATPVLDEKDPQAVALGYVADNAKVNKTKFPNFQPTQMCGNCALYSKPGALMATCPIFANKQVATKGWCSAYAKRA